MPERPLIAVVDDEASIRLAIRSLIKSAGYRVEVFASAGEFLESEATDNTHCLVTDVRMPEIDGLELVRRLRSRDIRVPVIFVTAYLDVRFKTSADHVGAIAVLSKPFEADALIACIESALNIRSDAQSRKC